MGVHGLWRLIEPSGKPVPLETLENKVLAVDISIWLHQAVKGFQDSKGASVPNAHLLGIYHRVCKLLYFKIKPVFVFDGGVPALKKQTIAKRTQFKLRNVAHADRIQRQLLNTLLKHSAVSKVLAEQIESSIGIVPSVSSRKGREDMFALPEGVELDSTISSSEDEESYSEQDSSTTTDSSPTKNWDLHSVDVSSVHFKSLPVDVRHEILTDLKETRKQSSWGRLHELPKISDDFSVYQMNRLLKRQAVQAELENLEKEMGGKSLSLAELESILKDQGVLNTKENVGTRIASDEKTKYLLVKDVKKAMEEAKKNELVAGDRKDSKSPVIIEENNEVPLVKEKTKAELEEEEDLRKAIALSLEAEDTAKPQNNSENPSTSSSQSDYSKKSTIEFGRSQKKINPAEFSFLENFTDADFASSSDDEKEKIEVTKLSSTTMSSAQSYMLEYSGLTPNEIAKIMNENIKKVAKESKNIKNALPTIKESKNENIARNTDKDGNSKQGANDNIPIEDNKISRITDDVEVMSTSSSESDDEEKPTGKHIVNVPKINEKQIVEEKSTDVASKDNERQTLGDEIEIMSSCSDSDVELKPENKALDIIIDPNIQFKAEDDLFGDIFSENNETENAIQLPVENFQKIETNDEVVKIKNDVASSKIEDSSIALISNNEKIESKEETKNLRNSEQIGDNNENTSKGLDVDANITTEDRKDDIKSVRTENEIKDQECSVVLDGAKDSKKVVGNSDFGNREPKSQNTLSEQDLLKLKSDLQKEKVNLLNEMSTKERMAGNITDQMYQEAQELLELFGVPYIVAPMEAEAQCAFLDEAELTDGTITDDSDIWLFGGRTVYKNFFNQSKYVMEFRAENIQHHFKLTRQQMILLALLVGSDYTIGLQGVGPVTAMEILAAFPPAKGKVNEFSLSQMELLSGLKEFRAWFTKGKSPGPGRTSLKNKLKNLIFTENFPSVQVVEAYLQPEVESSKEPFSWGKPNSLALIEFAREKFGWTRTKTEEILNPVLKKLEELRHQKSIKEYFKTKFKIHSGEAEKQMSKRVRSSIENMGRDASEIIAEELEEELKKQKKTKRATRKKLVTEAPEFSKKGKTSKESKSQEVFEDPTGNEEALDVSDKVAAIRKRRAQKNEAEKAEKVNLRKIKPKKGKIKENSDDVSGTDVVTATDKQLEVELDVSEKIEKIRKRRKLKEIKATIEIKKPKIAKETLKGNKFNEDIPEGLEGDEEVNLLSQIACQSSQKVDEINKAVLNEIEKRIATVTSQASVPSTSKQPENALKPTPYVPRPVARVTRVPKKEVIPQKQRDQTTLLRNKLKAIETFRKGKKGPGYVPKRDRKRRAPKANAELSEDSD